MAASTPRIVASGLLLTQGELELGVEAAHHAKVMRLKAGDALSVCDGNGKEMRGEVISLSAASLRVLLIEEVACIPESGLTLTLLQGLPKGDKMELVLQKATELGASRIVAVQMERSVAKLSSPPARWEKIVQEAARQCGRRRLPEVLLLSFAGALSLVDSPGALRLIFDESGQSPRLRALLPKEASEVCVLVGPEGGLSPKERSEAQQAGFLSAYLGERILRTETAGVIAVALLQHYYGDLG